MTGRTDDRPAFGPADEESLIHALLDGELDGERRAELERRLDEDGELRRRVDLYAEQKRRLAAALAAAAEGPTDPYTDTLAEALVQRLARPARLRWLRRAAFAAVLLAAGWWVHDLGRLVADPVPDIVADAAQIHELFAEDPEHHVELPPAESEAISRWMSRQLGEPVEVPDLKPLGLTFLGGRLLANEEGPFAQLVYETSDGRRLSLYLSGETGEGERDLELVEIDGLNAGYWEDDDLAYTLVARVSPQRLLAIASELGASADRL